MKARETGTLALIHVPLPFKLTLEDGFNLGFDNDEARFFRADPLPLRAYGVFRGADCLRFSGADDHGRFRKDHEDRSAVRHPALT